MEVVGLRIVCMVTAVDSNLKQLAKLAEGKDIKISNIHPGSGVESHTIATCVEKLYGHYHLLAERYNQMALEQGKSGGGLDDEKSIMQNGKETLLLKRIEDLEILNAKLQSSEEDAAKLKSELEDDEILIQQLQEKLELAQTLAEKQEAHHQSEMSRLLEKNSMAVKIFEEQELRIKSLETEIGQLNIELAKTKSTHEAESINSLQKCIDILHEKYDMANARWETLNAELSHKDDVIQQLNEHITQLTAEKADLIVTVSSLMERQNDIRQLEDRATQMHTALVQAISDSDESSRCIDKLRSRVAELEQELEEQRVLVAEGAELKKEAIRQLCTSLEHYRSAYHELGNVVAVKKSRVE